MEKLREALLRSGYPRWWVDMDPGTQLKTLRHDLGISQDQLASMARLKQSTISRLESGGDGKLSTWREAFGSLGYDFVVANGAARDDMEDYHEHERRARADKKLLGQF